MEGFTPSEVVDSNLEQENREKLEKETVFVQELLNTQLKLDEIHVGYGHPGRNQYTHFGIYRENDKKYASILLGDPPPLVLNQDLLATNLPNSKSIAYNHELTHVIQKEYSPYVQIPKGILKDILDEGVACAVELSSQNQKSSEKVSVSDVASHCKRIVNENSDTLLDPENVVGPSEFLDKEALTNIAMSKNRFYDGFNLKDRNMKYIAGISFVLNVLGDRIDKWTFLYDNPPTLEEVVNPDQYLARNGERLNNYTVNKVEPLHLKITSRSQTK